MTLIHSLMEMLPFWDKLLPAEKAELIETSVMTHYSKGEIVHTKNAECTGLLIVMEGEFRSYIASPTGREITLFKLYERDICMLSAACAFKNITYDVNLSAEKEAKAIVIRSAVFNLLAQKNHDVLSFLLEITQSKLSEIMYTLEQAVFFSLDYRIAHFLHEQSLLSDSQKVEITHEAIAGHLGSSREVVSRLLKQFEREGIVKLSRGKITVVAPSKLLEKMN